MTKSTSVHVLISIRQAPQSSFTYNYEVYFNLTTADYTTAGETKHFVGMLSFFDPPGSPGHGAHSGSTAERDETFDLTNIVDIFESWYQLRSIENSP